MNNQNLTYDIKDVTTESGTSEPVTLQEMKDYLRLEGFVDTDESTTDSLSDFDFDDTLISNMITAARKKLERLCGISIVFHSWKVLFTNMAGDWELPYGPVQAFTSLKSNTDTTLTAYTLRGFDFRHLEFPLGEKMVIQYDAGYEDCPEEISLAIKQCVAYWYENRVIGAVPALAKATVSSYIRPWTWLA